VLYSKWGIATDFIAVASRDRINSKREDMGFRCKLVTIPRTKNYLAILGNIKKALHGMIRSNNYDVIVISGMFMESLIPYLRKILPDAKVISDIHGATEDILEVGAKAKLIKRCALYCAYNMERYVLKKYLSKADGILVVSKALKEYLDKYYGTKGIPSYRIPCATTNKMMDAEEFGKNRKLYREKYDLKDNELLFIYSGGISPWQCIDETLEMYKEISNHVHHVRMLLISHNIDKLDEQEIKEYGILTDSYPPEEVEKVLCAGDYAFLLRKKSLTNKVAFPNKFLEYVRSGMRIIATPYIQDVSTQIKEFSLGTIVEPDSKNHMSIKQVIADIESERRDRNMDRDARERVLMYNSFENCLQKFVKENFEIK
jgi:glycosyltransferase involved in cell wall biosynthesis